MARRRQLQHPRSHRLLHQHLLGLHLHFDESLPQRLRDQDWHLKRLPPQHLDHRLQALPSHAQLLARRLESRPHRV
jgi:hypothetical protein